MIPFSGAPALTADQRAILAAPFRVPPGYGMRVLKGEEKERKLQYLDEEAAPLDVLLVWEPPRKGFRYVLSCDVSSGMGLDYACIDITRVGTIQESDEQVAQFVTNTVTEVDLAYYIDPIGRLYAHEGLPALAAIECNNMGISTQNELVRHVGYNHLFIWQYLDGVDAASTYTKRYGWYTTPRTRPLILSRYAHAIKTLDKHTGLPDYRINSPHTIAELSNFVTPGPLWMAEASEGATDDCIMAGAIGVHVAQTLQNEQRETIHETRRRVSEEVSRVVQKQVLTENKISPQNTDVTYDELMGRDPTEFDPHGEYADMTSDVPHYR